MLKTFINLTVLFTLILTSSCATILSGTTETIYVKSDIPGTHLYLDTTQIALDEGSIEVSKKRLQKIHIRAVKDGCQTTSMPIETQFNKYSLLGLFLDLGVISILVVDWGIYGATREAKKLNYVLSPICAGTP